MQRCSPWAIVVVLAAGCAKPAAVASKTPDPSRRSEHARSAAVRTSAARPAGAPSRAAFVGCGFLLVDSQGSTPYSVLLPGEEAKQVPDQDPSRKMMFVLDDVVVEVSTTTAREVGAPAARGTDLLEAHMRWEVEHLRQSMGWSAVEVAGGGLLSAGASDEAAMWGLDLPSDMDVMGQRVDRLAFVTAVLDDAVLALTLPLKAGADVRAPALKAGAIMRTLRRLSAPVDVVALGEEVKASHRPWSGCSDRS